MGQLLLEAVRPLKRTVPRPELPRTAAPGLGPNEVAVGAGVADRGGSIACWLPTTMRG